MIGKQFLFLSLIMLVFGGLMAMLIRWELAWPETPLPLIGASQQFIENGEPQTAMDKTWQEWLSQDDAEQNWLAKNYADRCRDCGVLQFLVYHARDHHDLLCRHAVSGWRVW